MYRRLVLLLFLAALDPLFAQSPTPEMVTLSFQDADVAQVVRCYAQLSGRKVSMQPGTTGKVSVVSLHPVPLNQAIFFIRDRLMQQGYEFRETGPNETFISRPPAEFSLPTLTPTSPTPTMTPIKWPPPNP